MLRITRLTDYGFILLAHIAISDHKKLYNAKDLSDELDIPLPTVSKVLKHLAKGELLVSHQGSQGGYCLSKDPSFISVADIIEVLEGPVSLTACCIEDGCSKNCSLSSSWQTVNNVIIDKLKSISLLDMAEGVLV